MIKYKSRLSIISTIILSFSLSSVSQVVQADWWSDNNPLGSLTPNWGPLIPKPQSPGELAPVCWGDPKKCRNNSENKNRPKDQRGQPVPQGFSSYVTYDYMCNDSNDNETGSCRITTRAQSCYRAQREQPYYTEAYDPCKNCVGRKSSYKYWTGETVALQGGPCKDF